jgi:parallel beta-helix repeat protein
MKNLYRLKYQIQRRIHLLSALFLLFPAMMLHGQNIVEVGGLFTQDQLWTSENEYHVVDNVRILLGTELRIEAGTTIKFNQGRGLYIEGGQLIVEGSGQDSVRMLANHSQGETWNWTGITVSSVTQPGWVEIQHAQIRDALVGLRSVSSSNLLIRNCHITNNRNIGISLFNSSYNTIQNNLISNNFLGMEIYASGPGNFSQYNEVLQNTFRNTTTNILIHNNNHGSCPHNNIDENLIDSGVHGIWLFNSTNQGGTGHVNISRNIIINNGTANDGYGIYVSMDSTTITHNIFWNNTTALNIIQAQKTHFLNNNVYNNKNGILMRSNASDVGLLNNTITATAGQVLTINYADELLMAQNNVFGSSADSGIIQNLSTEDLQIANNYWGSTNDSILQKLFYDAGNDPQLGQLLYEPVLLLPNTEAPVSAPANVSAQLINGQVRLSWNSNPETDLWGYHVYNGEFNNYAFDGSPVFVSDTVIILPATSLQKPIAVAALDVEATGDQPQLSGHESPFAFAKPLPYAGSDQVLCENELLVSLNQSTLPEGFVDLNWKSRGDGSFENANQLRTFYFPGPQDLLNGHVTLVLTAGHNNKLFADSLKVVFERQPLAFAGSQAIIKTDSLYTTSEATAENFNALWWSSTGDGSFDQPANLEAVYTPGANDLLNGETKLVLQAFSDYCQTASDTMTLTIQEAYAMEGRLWAGQEKLAFNPVIAIKTDQISSFQSHVIIYTDANGNFRFPSLFAGTYLLHVPIDTLSMEDYLPSYYVSSQRWQQAYELQLEGDVFDLDVYLAQNESPLPTGIGSLQGHFSLNGISPEDRKTYCMPWFAVSEQSFCDQGLSNVTVLLYGSSRERIYAHTLTDADGRFYFRNLPFGSYVLEVEMAGYESAVSETITLSPDQNMVEDILLQIEGENKVGIYLPKQDQSYPALLAYPNPTADRVTISSLANISNTPILVSVYSTDGRLAGTWQQMAQSTSIVLDLSGLKAGLYIIKLWDGDKETVFLQGKN